MSTLSQIQEMFLMNISVNNGSNETGPNIEQQVYDQIQIYLSTNNLGNWQIVWGAGVYVKEAGTVPDNVIYLAYDPTTSRYFLSVAGTNVASKGVSIVDFMEDLDVATTWQWPWNGAGSDVLVANEGQMVLNILSALTANSYVNGVSSGSQVTLVQYLTNQMSNAAAGSCTLITGGHSMGGAIAPLLALWLADTQATWDPNKAVSNFSSWPSAGPAIGTVGFQNYYQSRIPDSYRIYNTLDVVPRAWNVADMNSITTLYSPSIGTSDCVDFLVERCVKKVGTINYEQTGMTDQPLTGTINSSVITWYYPPGVNFGIQLGYQHVDAYFDLLGLDGTANLAASQTLFQNVLYWSQLAAKYGFVVEKPGQTF
jgi:hypothetical protein